MKSILELPEEGKGMAMIVVPKIREIFKSLGNVVLVFDNGDKRTIDTTDANKTLKDITRQIELFYTTR